jgi:hypothetical protein
VPPDPIVFGPEEPEPDPGEHRAFKAELEVRGLITDDGPMLFDGGGVMLRPGDTLSIRREGVYWFTFIRE